MARKRHWRASLVSNIVESADIWLTFNLTLQTLAPFVLSSSSSTFLSYIRSSLEGPSTCPLAGDIRQCLGTLWFSCLGEWEEANGIRADKPGMLLKSLSVQDSFLQQRLSSAMVSSVCPALGARLHVSQVLTWCRNSKATLQIFCKLIICTIS